MRDDLLRESEQLTRSWAHHDANWLREYLVAGVEDPRLNVQSILTRHFVIRAVAGTVWDALMAEEYRFAATVRWLVDNAGVLDDEETRAAVIDALRRGADNAEGLQLPPFISHVFDGLSVGAGWGIPNYLETILLASGDSIKSALDCSLDTFADLWRRLLSRKKSETGPDHPNHLGLSTASDTASEARPSVLEPACGSANDFRFLHLYGISELVDYQGFDLCSTNVENARGLFPEASFERGNVFDIQAADKSFDLCIVHDLFEHFSLAGLEQAVKEVCRVTRKGISIGFFQMDEIGQHVVRPVEDYHWNLLSMTRTRELFAREGFAGQVIHIDTFLAQHAIGAETHNPNAYTFMLHRS